MSRKNPDLKLSAEQRAIVNALCEHDLYASGTSGSDVIIGCRKCPAEAARSATGRRSTIEWGDEATPSVTLVRVAVSRDYYAGNAFGSPEEMVDPADTALLTDAETRKNYALGKFTEKHGTIDVTYEDLVAVEDIEVDRAELVEAAKALDDLLAWIDKLDRARSFDDLVERQAEIFDIGDFGPALNLAGEQAWGYLNSLVEQGCYADEAGARSVTGDDVDALQDDHAAYKAAFYLALSSCIDAKWECGTEGYFRFFDHRTDYLANEVEEARIESKIKAMQVTEEWAFCSFDVVGDGDGLRISARGEIDSSCDGIVCERIRPDEDREAALKRAVALVQEIDAHWRGQYMYMCIETTKVYRPSDLDHMDWEDGEGNTILYTDDAEWEDVAGGLLAAEVSALEKDGVTVINLGVVDVD